MIKLLILFCAIYFQTINTYAVTAVRFIPGGRQVAITIANQTSYGSDNDAGTLYEHMNITPENSFLGPGKTVSTAEKDLNFVCAIRDNSNPTCSIVLNASSPRVKISSGKKYAHFIFSGEQAEELSRLWHLKDGEFNFLNNEGNLKLHIKKNLFHLEYKQ